MHSLRSRLTCGGLVVAVSALGLTMAGCTKSEGTTTAAPKKPAPRAAEPAKPQGSSETEGNSAAPGRGRGPAAAQPIQRVFRPSVTVPHHDDRQLAERGIRRYESKHLILYTDIDPSLARPLPKLMDQAYAAWEEYFGRLPPDREGTNFQMIGYIMADQALFREAGLMTDDIHISLEGVYKNQVFWMNDQPIDYYRRHLMIHEGTHCFMMAFPNPTNQFIWYVEGMAELFRAHQTDPDGQTHFRLFPRDKESFGGLGWIRLIHDDLRTGGPRTIEAVIGMPVNAFQKYNAYAWSWALCAFLDGHPKYRDRFRRIGSLVTTRNEAAFELQAAFKADWRELSEEWLVFAGNICYGYDIERTVLDLRPGKPLAPAGEPASLQIAAERGWQSSGLLVERGKTYRIAGTGRCVLARDPKPWESEAQGISFRYHAGHPVGMLIGAIRSATPLDTPPHTTMLEVLPIGRENQITPQVTGTLYFRVNDYWNELADNSGSFHVTVEARPD